MTSTTKAAAPHPLLAGTDLARATGELGMLACAWPALLRAPAGDGHPVLLMPGLATSDTTMWPLRRTLRGLGYRAYGWDQGVNIGPTARILAGMRTRFEEIADREGRPISLVGWSLGGIYARRMARERPDLVRQVITLGSPFKLSDHRQSNARRVYRALSRWHAEDLGVPLEQGAPPMPVPTVALYSRLDGIAAWQVCRDPDPAVENIEVLCSHLGFAHSLPALWAIADRLATPIPENGDRDPFTAPLWLRYGYPRRR